MPANYKIIGNRIQKRRKAKNITQEQMAEYLNVTPGYISQLERGTTKINLDILSAISEYLECDMAEFIYKNDHYSMSFYEDEILSHYEQLSPSERQMLGSLLRTYIENK